MTDGLVELTNQAVVAVLVGCGGVGLVLLVGLVAWLGRQARPEPRKPPPPSVVFTRRARSSDGEE